MSSHCPSPLKAEHLNWVVTPRVRPLLEKIFKDDDPTLVRFPDRLSAILCPYYDATKGLQKQGKSINPIGNGGVPGGKGFKVRFQLPGKGKSGGLRLGVLAICSRMTVFVAFAEVREEEPPIAEFEEAFREATR